MTSQLSATWAADTPYDRPIARSSAIRGRVRWTVFRLNRPIVRRVNDNVATDALLRGLTAVAVEDLVRRVTDAELDRVPVREGVARLARAFVTAGGRYAVLAQTRKDPATAEELDRTLGDPVRALLERGISDGTLRADLPVELQFTLFTGLLEHVLALVAADRIGVEQASAAITTVFLDGATAR